MKPLAVRIDTIPAEGRDVKFRFGADEVNAELSERGVADIRLTGDIEGEARFLQSGAEVYVLGKFSARVTLACVRCLAEFDSPLTGEFHLALSREAPSSDEEDEAELSAADLELEPLEGEEIDLAALAVEQFLLALPPYPLCREGCKGLCPRCGAERNREPCVCAEGVTDPRLAVLAKLKKPE